MTTAQKKLLKKRISIALAALISVVGIGLNAHKVSAQTETIAQDQVALTAIPPRLGDDGTLTAAPGEKIQIQLRLRNISEQSVDIVTTAEDFILSEDGETPVPIDNSASNRWSLASWLTMTPTEHSIASKETVGINVLIEVPQDALPGGHYAMVLHKPGTEIVNEEFVVEEEDSSSAVSQRVGTLIYLTVEGPINEEAYVRDFSFPKFTEYGPVPFSLSVDNNSDIHITPQMNVEIFNILGQRVDNIQIEPKNIFPLTDREFKGNWNRVWGLGFYKARLTMSYGSGGSVVIANTNFWLLPIKIIIAIIVITLILITLVYSIKRHLDHRKDQDKNKIDQLEQQIQDMQNQETREMEHDDNM